MDDDVRVTCVELSCGVCSSGNNNGDGFDSFAAGRGKRWVGRQAGQNPLLVVERVLEQWVSDAGGWLRWVVENVS